MSEALDKSIELEELLLRVLSDQAADDELVALNQSLKDSAALRSEVSQFLLDDSLITELSFTRKQADSIIERLSSSRLPEHRDDKTATPKSFVHRAWQFVNRHGVAVGAIAAMLLIGQFAYNLALLSRIDRLHDLAVAGGAAEEIANDRGAANFASASVAEGIRREVVGRIAGLNNVVWSEGEEPLLFGERVKQGQVLKLDSGVVELLLSTGAKVTIEGPAHFEATSELETTLLEGKIAAAAPRVARGYTVLTPTAELVEIGTQFGVMVEESGDSELHVFDGDVVARSRFAPKGAALIHAKEHEAMRFDSVSAEPRRIAAREIDFVRHIAPLRAPDELPPIPSTRQLALWYSVDMCTGLVVGDRVGILRDLLVGDNDFADNAWQFDEARRPTFLRDGAGRPALRFDGWSTYFATSPMEVSEQQTMFVVCAPAPINFANNHQGQILLKFAETPSLELSVMPDLTARGWVWPGPGKSNVGTVQSKQVGTGQPVVIGYAYDSDGNQARLWVNGELQGTAEAPVPIVQSGQSYIGSHNEPRFRAAFFGNIYEIAVFNEVFDEVRLSEFWSYFSQRYDIK